jgi:DNA modification methylase
MHRILKPTGSIYLHCDWHADAYIRVYILDKIFGRNNFRNEIIWRYSSGGASKKFYSRNHDNIYFYTKSNKYHFSPNEVKVARTEKSLIRSKNPIGARYDKENVLKLPEDIFDIQILNPMAKERIGYPTQKPFALLERIIKASSNEGDIILDPFMGGGTTMVVANRTERNYIGIDQSIAAVDVSANRLRSDAGIFKDFEIEKHFYAEEDLKEMLPFEFEKWIIEKFGGKPNTKQTGDKGIDGTKDGVPIQVKRWKNKIGKVEIQKFLGACHSNRLYDGRIKDKLPVGYFIAFEFTKEAVGELARLERENGIIIEKVLVSEIVSMARKPVVHIKYEITDDGKYRFIATSDSKIINFSWDFEYGVSAHKHPDDTAKFNPSVLYDKTGVRIHNFSKNGEHNVAVKVVDEKYLENIKVCSISIL